MMGGPPTVANRKIGGELATQVRHREYIGDISVTLPPGTGVVTADWQIVKGPLAINPGMPELFPWLSGVAGHYVQYEINGMICEYISTSGSAIGASANQSIGSVSLACQYDSLLGAYNSKQEMLNDQMAVSGVPYVNHILGIECQPQQSVLTKQYIRTRAVPDGADPRMYDLGQVYVAVDGIQGTAGSTVTLGELWVSYDVILLKSSLSQQPPLGDGSSLSCGLVGSRTASSAEGSVPNWGTGNLFISSYGPTYNRLWDFIGVQLTADFTTQRNVLTLPDITTFGIDEDELKFWNYAVAVSFNNHQTTDPATQWADQSLNLFNSDAWYYGNCNPVNGNTLATTTALNNQITGLLDAALPCNSRGLAGTVFLQQVAAGLPVTLFANPTCPVRSQPGIPISTTDVPKAVDWSIYITLVRRIGNV